VQAGENFSTAVGPARFTRLPR